jgi:peptidyl-dipeptidase Dcp
MKKTVLLIGIFTVMTMLVNAQNDNEMPKDNPLVLEWETPYQTPPFDKIKPEHYIPAYNYAIKAAKEEIYRITHVKMKPSFNNTIAALDRSGSLLNRINGVFFNMLYCNPLLNFRK